MTDFLPKEVREGLELARRSDFGKRNRLRLHVGERIFTIRRFWDTGLAVDVLDAPHLRGFVDIYDGARHLSQCLIVASEEEAGEMIYEIKFRTAAADAAPLDYEKNTTAPVALIGRRGG